MSKTADERVWHLSQFAAGGWQIHRYAGVKKWDAHLSRHLKDGDIEQDGPLYRITDKGTKRVLNSRYAHFVPLHMRRPDEEAQRSEADERSQGNETVA